MRTYNHKEGTTTEFSVTPNGNFIATVATNDKVLIRTTPEVSKFVTWMMGSSCPLEESEEDRKISLMRMISWWEMPTAKSRGSFNVELYNRILSIKKQK